MHAKSSIQSFYKHVESDANVVDGLLREAEADELAQGWDAFRADVPLQHREASCRSKRSQSFWDCLKEKARARTRRSLSCSVRSQQWLCALPLYACAQAHVIGVRAGVRHVHWFTEVSEPGCQREVTVSVKRTAGSLPWLSVRTCEPDRSARCCAGTLQPEAADAGPRPHPLRGQFGGAGSND